MADWFVRADRNRDGAITADEMQADADRFFATLDSNRDGEIDPEELVQYEWEIAPDIQVMSRTRPPPGHAAAKARQESADGAPRREHRRSNAGNGDDFTGNLTGSLQGAARYGLLNLPEPVAAADTNFDRGISLSEFRQAAAARFQLLDTSRIGKLTLDQLQLLRAQAPSARHPKRDDKAGDLRVGNPLPPGN
jgi:hypothetical protein